MKTQFKKAKSKFTDKRGKSIKIDDICRIDIPTNKVMNGLSGRIKKLNSTNGMISATLEIHTRGHKKGTEQTVLVSSLKRIKKAHETSEYKIPRNDRRRWAENVLGSRNEAMSAALMHALEKKPR